MTVILIYNWEERFLQNSCANSDLNIYIDANCPRQKIHKYYHCELLCGCEFINSE